MKHILAAALLLLASGCIKKNAVSFSGLITGVKNGVFLVKDVGDSTVYGENIKDGKFVMKERQLKYPGYYVMTLSNSDSANKTLPPFEIYLESGSYAIESTSAGLYRYPKIISPSKIQAQISAYYTLADQLYDEKFENSKKLNEQLRGAGGTLSVAAYNALNNRAIEADKDLNNIPFLALSQFVKEHPESEVSAHLMAKQNYQIDPVAYYKLYNTFSKAEKNTDDGKELGDKLSKLSKLVVGAKAPPIVGKTPAGDPFDQSKIKGKIILIDFWRAGNEISRRNHENIINFLGEVKDPKRFGVISISIDTKVDWWVTAINEDHITWTQISDLKGDDSPNAANWGISKIPTYYLVNDKWEIVDRDMNINRLAFEVDDYLSHHH